MPTFYCEAQKLIRDIRTFKPSFVEGAALSIYNDSLYLYGGIGGAGVRTNITKYDISINITFTNRALNLVDVECDRRHSQIRTVGSYCCKL